VASKDRPSGFVARCRCGNYTGAMDLERTGRAEAGKMLGAWLFDGKTVEPRFGGSWSQHLESCNCASSREGERSDG
jgi:hypothetical protein